MGKLHQIQINFKNLKKINNYEIIILSAGNVFSFC
jgi:hypothetical protein